MTFWDHIVFAKNNYVLDRLIGIVVNVLFHRENCLILVSILELLWQFLHSQVSVFVTEWDQLELEINFVASRLLRMIVRCLARRLRSVSVIILGIFVEIDVSLNLPELSLSFELGVC